MPLALTQNAQPVNPILNAYITNDEQDIEQACQLRQQIFTQEFSANITGDSDRDRFDGFCHHLVVKEVQSGEIVAYSRIITHQMAKQHGGYYTQGEFNIDAIIEPQKRYMEIGRTCVNSEYRSGACIAMLWGQIGQFMLEHNIDFLFGCASIPFAEGCNKTMAVINYLRNNHFTPPSKRVIPKHPLPLLCSQLNGKDVMPPLLKAYIRMGCMVCGEAHWDKEFNSADVMILLPRENINMRYLKHFLKAA